MTATTIDWTHRPERTDHEAERPGEPDAPCFGCVCYGCGQPTDGPRDPRGDTRTDLTEPTSHRWCFE